MSKQFFEANMLDGDKVEDCGGAMLSAADVWEFISKQTYSREEVEQLIDRAKIEAAQYVILSCKERIYSTPYGSYEEFISRNLIVDYIKEIEAKQLLNPSMGEE